MQRFAQKARHADIGGMKIPIGAVIRKLREKKGLTLADLAEAPGVKLDAGNLSRVERGLQAISVKQVEAIAARLGTGVSELYRMAEGAPSDQPGKSREELMADLLGTLTKDEIRWLAEAVRRVMVDKDFAEMDEAQRKELLYTAVKAWVAHIRRPSVSVEDAVELLLSARRDYS